LAALDFRVAPVCPPGPVASRWICVHSDPYLAPGTYTAFLACAEGEEPSNSRIITKYEFTQTILAAQTRLSLPQSATPGQTITISGGGGCGPYGDVKQVADIYAQDQVTGEQTKAQVSVALDGRWGPVSMKLPAKPTTGWYVGAQCHAADYATDKSSYIYNFEDVSAP
jgi:hypothetical protein